MDEEKKAVETEETETKKAKETDEKTEKKEKSEKVGLFRKAKRLYRRHRGAVWGTIGGFAAGAGSMFGISELGRRHQLKMAEKNAVPTIEDSGYSSLDPNVD